MDGMKLFRLAITGLLFLVLGQTASANWTKLETGTLAWLRSVFFVNEKKGWIGGGNGTFLTTEDGGASWRKLKNVTADNIRDVFFRDESTGWLLCERDIHNTGGKPLTYTLTTTDGGASWETVAIGEGSNRLSRFFFSKSGKGFAVGEGGAYWVKSIDEPAWKKSMLPVRNLILAGTFLNDNVGIFVGGGGVVLLTDDGGKNWNPTLVSAGGSKRSRLNAVVFANEKRGWTVGENGTIFKTANGGKSWSSQNSGTNENLNDVFFANEVSGIVVGDGGTILRTDNGGETWKPERSGTKNRLDDISIVGGNTVAVGLGGTILIRKTGVD